MWICREKGLQGFTLCINKEVIEGCRPEGLHSSFCACGFCNLNNNRKRQKQPVPNQALPTGLVQRCLQATHLPPHPHPRSGLFSTPSLLHPSIFLLFREVSEGKERTSLLRVPQLQVEGDASLSLPCLEPAAGAGLAGLQEVDK